MLNEIMVTVLLVLIVLGVLCVFGLSMASYYGNAIVERLFAIEGSLLEIRKSLLNLEVQQTSQEIND